MIRVGNRPKKNVAKKQREQFRTSSKFFFKKSYYSEFWNYIKVHGNINLNQPKKEKDKNLQKCLELFGWFELYGGGLTITNTIKHEDNAEYNAKRK